MRIGDQSGSAGLIFDVGMHHCEDTDFYLSKGFRVVAVEAVAEFCADAALERREAIASGELVVENVAVTQVPGPVQFYRSTASVWGTIRPDWVERNRRLGHEPGETVIVPGVTLRSLMEKHGVPHYIKIDIEGADLAAIESLHGCPMTPRYVSIESNKTSWRGLRKELRVLRNLGYRWFKVVNQHSIADQLLPAPSREGRTVTTRFSNGSSGLFGADLPGRWMGPRETILRYALIFLRYRINGDDGLVSRLPCPSFGHRVARRLVGEAGWFDTHATQARPAVGAE